MNIKFGMGYRATFSLLTAVFVTSFVVLYVLPVAMAQTDTVTVNVNIAQVSEITVNPTTLNFTTNPGTATAETTLGIQNTGSLNVSHVYATVDTLVTEPVSTQGSANSQDFAASGVMKIENETVDTQYWAGRLEWNNSEPITNLVTSAVTDFNASFSGFIRNTSFEYLFIVGNGTAPDQNATDYLCNNTDVEFAYTTLPDNGTTVTRTPATIGATNDGADESWAYFSINNASSILDGHCVATYFDCSKIYIYRYDKTNTFGTGNFGTCTNSEWLNELNLVPGATHSINMSANLPLGIPANPGALNTSVLTIQASAGI